MEKLKMQTADGVQDNISRIAELFPECITEVKTQRGGIKHSVDFDKLRQLLSSDIVEGNEERYQFTWPDKRKAILAANAPINATLRPCPEESVDFDTTQNLYIEGDNLDVLKCLKETYLHKVKMIYIDPPYNTGNDFVYEDDFAESAAEYLANSGQFDEQGNRLVTNTESNGRFHTDWLNMIYPRLKVARDLLTEDGVIFISIDDNEVGNLRKICDEIFGASNLISVLSWKRRKTQANLAKNISQVHEYILVYAKDIDKAQINKVPYTEEYINKAFCNKDNDPKGVYQTGPLARPANSSNREYTLTMPNGRDITAKWSCSQDTFNRYVEEGRLYIPKDGQGMPRIKIYLSELPGMIPNTWLDNIASNDDASRMIESLFGTNAFLIILSQ